MILQASHWHSAPLSQAPSPAPKLLLLHGMGGTGALWRPIGAALEDRFDILAPDQRGHGRSRPAEGGFTPLDYGRDVLETLDAHSFVPTWAVGHSMGVRSAVAAAYLRPEAFRGLVLVDLGFSGMAGGGLGEGLARFIRVLPREFESRAKARAFMTEHCPDPSIAQYLMAVSQVGGDGSVSFPFDSGALIQTIEAAGLSSVRPWALALAERGMPILALRGGASLVWAQELYEEERRAFAAYPHVSFETVDGASHGLPFERRPWFVERLTRFFAGT